MTLIHSGGLWFEPKLNHYLFNQVNATEPRKLNFVNFMFGIVPQFEKWSVDVEDSDNVLRIMISDEGIMESDIIDLLSTMNIRAEELA